MVKHSRRFSTVAEKIELEKKYLPLERREPLREVSTANSAETA